MEKQNPKRIKYFIHLIISIIYIIGTDYVGKTYPNDAIAGLIAASGTIFGGILFLVSGYKFIFYKKWIQTIEKNKKLK